MTCDSLFMQPKPDWLRRWLRRGAGLLLRSAPVTAALVLLINGLAHAIDIGGTALFGTAAPSSMLLVIALPLLTTWLFTGVAAHADAGYPAFAFPDRLPQLRTIASMAVLLAAFLAVSVALQSLFDGFETVARDWNLHDAMALSAWTPFLLTTVNAFGLARAYLLGDLRPEGMLTRADRQTVSTVAGRLFAFTAIPLMIGLDPLTTLLGSPAWLMPLLTLLGAWGTMTVYAGAVEMITGRRTPQPKPARAPAGRTAPVGNT